MKKALTGILLVVFCVLTGEAQTLRLTSPNGGESWEQGTVRAITWTSSGITARVRLILFKDGARLGQIADDLDIAAGSFSWTVGNYGRETAAAGGGYKVRIRTVDGDVVEDSNACFTITESEEGEARDEQQDCAGCRGAGPNSWPGGAGGEAVARGPGRATGRAPSLSQGA